MSNKEIIYFDNSATTPVHPQVKEAMMPYFEGMYANPSSVHKPGQAIKADIDRARESVASFLNCAPHEIVFTATGTEADNFALLRSAELNSDKGKHIVVSSVEHKAIIEPAKFLEKRGFDVSYLPVDENCRVSVADAEAALRKDTAALSLMFVNNEVGTVEPLREIAGIYSRQGVIVHTDAVHAAGKVELDIDRLGVDMLSLSGHKIYAPKGIGALFIREDLKERIRPFIYGGFQEYGLRAGTENVAYIMGFAKAVELIAECDDSYVGDLRDYFESLISDEVDDVVINCVSAERVSSISSVTFKGVDSAVLMGYMPEICVSAGSACMARQKEGSHVLQQMGLSQEDIRSTLRFSFGMLNTEDEVERAVQIIKANVQMLRRQ